MFSLHLTNQRAVSSAVGTAKVRKSSEMLKHLRIYFNKFGIRAARADPKDP